MEQFRPDTMRHLDHTPTDLKRPTKSDGALASQLGCEAQLVSMISATELNKRPSRPPDHEAEAQALIALAREMAASPSGILQTLADTALVLCGADSAGLSILEERDQRKAFHWRALAGQWASHLDGGTPREFGPCGTVLDRNEALLCSHPERDFPYFGEITPLLEEGLLVPFYIKGEAVGTIWIVVHDAGRRFDAEDLRVMRSLGIFASAAYQTVLALEATHRVSAIVECSIDAVISKDLHGIITTWNPSAERLFGYAATEAIGRSVSILIPSDREEDEPAIIERIRRGERIQHYETVRVRKDGSRVDVSLSVSPIKGAEGEIIGASKIARDITDRKRADEALRRAEEEFRDFVDNASVGMHWVGPDGIILWANHTEMEMLGYAPQEYIGRHIAAFHADQETIDDMLRRLGNHETLHNYEATLLCKDGSIRHVLVNSNVMWDGDAFVHTRCVTRDITERKQSEAHVAILAREAEHRSRNVLSIVQATVNLSQADSAEGLKRAIGGRIRALANVNALFVESRWAGADLRSVISQELSPYCNEAEARVRIAGPDIVLEAAKAQAIAVTVHELATNAVKYGALSVLQGKVDIEWSRAPDWSLRLCWTETGGPPVGPSTRQGFGTRLMDGMIRDQMKGELRFDWRPEGFACVVLVPE